MRLNCQSMTIITATMPTSVRMIEHDAEHRVGDEVLHGVDVAGQPDHHVARPPALVKASDRRWMW